MKKHLTNLKKLLNPKHRVSLSILIFIIVGLSLSLTYDYFAKGATYGWLQSSWSGGTDTISTADHTNNQSNWNKFFSKNDNILANTEITLNSTNLTKTDSTTENFQTGTNTNGIYPIINTNNELKLDIPTCNTTPANAGPDQSDSATCGLTTVTLNGNAPTVGTGSWTKVSGTGGSFANSNLRNTTFTGTAGLTYVLRWTITNGACPASTDDVTITFNQNPTVANAGVDQVLCSGATSTILTGNTPSIGTGIWSIVSGTATITSPNSPTSGVTGLVAGTTITLRWTISNPPCNTFLNDVIITIPAVFVTEIVDVTNPITGKTWMDRNLGATRAATSSTDTAAYGDLYQWGRLADGHQCRNSLTTSILSNTDLPEYGNFILSPNSPYDWRSPQNDNLWQGINGINNPCPNGYRIPTDLEMLAEMNSWSAKNATGAYGSVCKFTRAGSRSYSIGSLVWVGTMGWYWTSAKSGIYSYYMYTDSSQGMINSNYRATGASVRCIKN